MASDDESRFAVAEENEEAALAHLSERGYQPIRIERDEDGLIGLVFAAIPDDQMHGLAMALPVHLSAKIGIVASSPEDFEQIVHSLRKPH